MLLVGHHIDPEESFDSTPACWFLAVYNHVLERLDFHVYN